MLVINEKLGIVQLLYVKVRASDRGKYIRRIGNIWYPSRNLSSP